MKVKITMALIILLTILMTGCGNKKDDTDGKATPAPGNTNASATPAPGNTNTSATPAPGGTDAVTTASIVNDEAAFKNAISANGTWIIAILNDMTISDDITLDGEFKNGKKDDAGKEIIQRKVALYTQDENRNITARFTLKAPKFTINSPEASIQHGTFVGDLYVNSANFKLIDATVDGNVYFKDADTQSTFTMDADSKVTGTQGLAQ